jgi:hypothetical protein
VANLVVVRRQVVEEVDNRKSANHPSSVARDPIAIVASG